MAASFDPYHKWLGIPPKDQPPHHYRLLGIELFEDDSEVIESAANRLMTYLHDVAAGDSTGQSQKLLNEISAARICLLSRQRKAAYDRQLERDLRQSKTTGSPPSPPPPAVRENVREKTIDRDVASVKRRRLLVASVVFGIGSLVVIVVLIATARNRNEPIADHREDVVSTRERSLPEIRKPQRAMLVLDWPRMQRAGASLEVNGVQRPIPATSDIRFPIDAGPLQLRMTRPGYIDIVWESVVSRGELVRYSPVWEPKNTVSAPNGKARQAGQPPGPQRAAKTASSNGKKTPAVPRPTASKRPKTPTTKKPAATSVKLPSVLPLPLFSASGVKPWAKLIDGLEEQSVALRLVGGELLMETGSFQLSESAPGQGQRVWHIDYIDRKQHRTIVAELECKDKSLCFRWHPECELRQANQLRNALLEVAIGTRDVLLPMREPVRVQPLTLSGAKGIKQSEIRIDTLPMISRLRLKIVRSSGATSFAKKFKDRIAKPGEYAALDLGVAKDGYPLNVRVRFQAPRTGARVVELECQVSYHSAIAQGMVALSRNNTGRDLTWAQEIQRKGRSGPNQKQRDKLARDVDYYAKLDKVARGESPLKLHYQLLFMIDDHPVVLATTQPSPSGSEK